MPRRRTTTTTTTRGALLLAVAIMSGVDAFAFHHPASRLPAGAGARTAARRASPVAMSTKDDVDSGSKAPSMPFASAPLQLEKGGAPASAPPAAAAPVGRRKPGE